ncbi:MAG: NAD(P)-binding protein [Pararobbsia sp.]
MGRSAAAKHKTARRSPWSGSGPAGLAAAQQLARAGHAVTVFEKNDRAGGLLRYGIPDFKMEKGPDRPPHRADGARRRDLPYGACTSAATVFPAHIQNGARETISPKALRAEFDAVVIAGGAEMPRDLPVPGRDLRAPTSRWSSCRSRTRSMRATSSMTS